MDTAGSGPLELAQGLYSIRLEHLAGVELWIDYVLFIDQKMMHLVLVQADEYSAFHDIGGKMIQRLPVYGCSSGYVLYGLDRPGEWTGYIVSIEKAGTYQFNLRSQGAEGETYALRLLATDITGTEPTTWGAIKKLLE